MALSLSQLNPQDSNFAVEVIDRLLPLAVQSGASDLHLQPREQGWEALLRVDGVLTPLTNIPGGGQSDPVARLMVLAGLPTYRDTQPMEARLHWPGVTTLAAKHPAAASLSGESESEQAPGERISMRLGVFPTIHGPRAVIRLLRRDSEFDSIESLRMPADITAGLQELCHTTDGAILLAGPSGSGKTTTMYAMLREIAAASPRRSVVTIEDPVESVIDSISQSELEPSAGMTLSSALRSAVRQDSEVLLVSEVRDPETAEAALQASLTGHLVFSSLHATDVAASLRRLVQLGVPHYVVRSGIRAIICQRLIRRICHACRPTSPARPDEEACHNSDWAGITTLDSTTRNDESDAPDLSAIPENACHVCLGSGYRGRMAIAQCIRFDGNDPVGDCLADALEQGKSADKMRQLAFDAGDIDLWQRGKILVEEGKTDMPELYRVLGLQRVRASGGHGPPAGMVRNSSGS